MELTLQRELNLPWIIKISAPWNKKWTYAFYTLRNKPEKSSEIKKEWRSFKDLKKKPSKGIEA